MPTDLPARTAPPSKAAHTTENLQAIFLFYLGMALIALLLVSSERYFEISSGDTIVESMLKLSPSNMLIDGIEEVRLPESP
jgi:hypothetical protein